jgi:hypothetical protein
MADIVPFLFVSFKTPAERQILKTQTAFQCLVCEHFVYKDFIFEAFEFGPAAE